MNISELEDAITEFVKANTSDFRFASNDETQELIEPRVWSGFVPRDEVGAIMPGEVSTYPAIIVNVHGGETVIDRETTDLSITICCFDANRDQQGYRDCMNVVQRLKDRFREVDIIYERFAWVPPLNWTINRKLGTEGMNAFPYFFADMELHFLMPVMSTQFETDSYTGDTTLGRYNEVPIPTPEPNEHWKLPVPPPIKIIDHDLRWPPAPPPGPDFPITP